MQCVHFAVQELRLHTVKVGSLMSTDQAGFWKGPTQLKMNNHHQEGIVHNCQHKTEYFKHTLLRGG